MIEDGKDKVANNDDNSSTNDVFETPGQTPAPQQTAKDTDVS